MSVVESVTYQLIAADQPRVGFTKKLRVYALSTCAFCEKAMAYLRDKNISYEYLMLDSLELETKRALKTELKEKFGSIPVFPLLVVDGETHLSGFTEEKWNTFLGIN